MNILYIGPYRLNANVGYLSLNLLLETHSFSTNLTCRPVYNGNPVSKLDEVENIISKIENTKLNNFDILIQHLDINSMVYTSKIKKHFFIPITNKQTLSLIQKQKCSFLENRGLFLSPNKISDYILSDAGINNKQNIDISISPRLIIKSSGSFNFGIYNQYQKYYSVVDAQSQSVIKNLILKFINEKQQEQSCLVIFLENINKITLDQYNLFIKNAYKELKINNSINKIILVPVDLNHKMISSIHHTGDVYIDLNDDIQAIYAQAYNSEILNINNNLKIAYDPEDITEYPKIKSSLETEWCYERQLSKKINTISNILQNNV